MPPVSDVRVGCACVVTVTISPAPGFFVSASV